MTTYFNDGTSTTVSSTTINGGTSLRPDGAYYEQSTATTGLNYLSGAMVFKPLTVSEPSYKAVKNASQDKMKITDVRIIVPGKVVEVKFADGLKEKVVCQVPDIFSLESAISICIAKHASGGHKAYHKAIKDAFKVYDEKLKKEAADAVLKEKIKERKAKKIAQKEKRKQKADEHQIKIQKEAYVRAMREMQLTD